MVDYVELHCHSNFSLLDGASHPEELVAGAAALDMPALALTDHDAVYGVPRFIRAAREQSIRPILGAEMTLEGGYHLTLLVENQAGWHNLCYLISRARYNRPKGQALLPLKELVGCANGLVALSGCRRGEIAAALLEGRRDKALAAARRYRRLFGRDNFFIELQRHFIPGEEQLVPRLAGLANSLGLLCVTTNNVHYATQDQHKLQDVLVAIRHRTSLDAATHLRRPNSEFFLKSAAQMAALFPDQPQAIANSQRLAERCGHFELDYGLQDLPQFPTPGGMSSSSYLRRLCEEALLERLPDPPLRAREQLAYELDVIEQSGLSNYFLIIWDLVRFARAQGIRCQGRGSAASSLVAYLLHIGPVNPLAHGLVFERFLARERPTVPDVDLDFDANRREEVIQYIYEQYGREHSAMACTIVSFQARSALRDVAKALGLAPEIVAEAAQALDSGPTTEAAATTDNASLHLLLDLCRQIEDFPRHLGIHAGGMVITGAPIMSRVPTEPAARPGRTVVQWDKDGLEYAGLIKLDVLGLGILAAFTDTLALIQETTGQTIDLGQLTFDDPAVYAMIARADTVGVFQVESEAQAQMLPRLKPHCFADLVVAISLIRPGPVQGNMVHPFMRRRLGLEAVTYLHPLLQPALEETLGVVLFQEQVLKIARDFAGFSPGQGEVLRRALGAKRAEAAIERLRDSFLAGAQAQGAPADVAGRVFEQLQAFGSFSFAKSHATSFAVLVYQSAWLKHYHFVPYYVALLNNQPMGYWNAAVLINKAKRQGVRVMPVDIHHSQARCTVEDEGIRLGFNYVKGMGEAQVDRLLAGRTERPFTCLADFGRRTRLGQAVVENLILAGALDGWGVPRRHLLWELGTLNDQAGELDLVFPSDAVSLPPLSPAEAMLVEQEVMGLSTGDHVMTFYRSWLVEEGILSSGQLDAYPAGQRVRAAGLVVVHQSPPTAKGHHFITLEDEEGMTSVIVRPSVYSQYRRLLHSSRLLVVEGTLQKQDTVISLLARHITAMGTV